MCSAPRFKDAAAEEKKFCSGKVRKEVDLTNGLNGKTTKLGYTFWCRSNLRSSHVVTKYSKKYKHCVPRAACGDDKPNLIIPDIFTYLLYLYFTLLLTFLS